MNSPAMAAAKQRIAGIARRRVSAPMAATTITAPAPAQNHMPPDSSGYRAIDASTVAVAAATVRRMFMGSPPRVGWPPPAGPEPRGGQEAARAAHGSGRSG